MNFRTIGSFPIDQDLTVLIRTLKEHDIHPWVTEQANTQVLHVNESSDMSRVLELVRAYVQQSNQDSKNIAAQSDKGHSQRADAAGDLLNELSLSWLIRESSRAFFLYPVTVMVVLLGGIGFFIGTFDVFNNIHKWLRFYPAGVAIQTGETWRLVTPAFLHFGGLHIIFNGLWMIYLGRLIEVNLSKTGYVLLFLFTAIFANYTQFLVGGSINFGGLSGVVFAFIGFIGVQQYYFKNRRYNLNKGIFGFTLFSLFIGFTGFTTLFGVHIANWAHLGGLIAGCAISFVYKPRVIPTE